MNTKDDAFTSKAAPNPAMRQADWDFSGVSPKLAETCFIYECFREWPQVIKDVEHFNYITASGKIYPPSRLPGRFIPLEGYTVVRNSYCLIAEDLRKNVVDDVPWQHLDQESQNWTKVRAEPPYSVTTLFDAIHNRQSPHVLENEFAISINWEASDSQILKYFEKLLKSERLTPPREIRGSKAGDWLKMLGAMRLLHAMPFVEAYDLSASTLKTPLYGKRPSWERARKGAVEVFRKHFFIDWKVLSPPPVPRSYPRYGSWQ